jgi:hypothetical protein
MAHSSMAFDGITNTCLGPNRRQEQPMTFELLVNLKTAKSLSLAMRLELIVRTARLSE